MADKTNGRTAAMHMSQTLVPIVHPKRFYKPCTSWKRRTKRCSQYRVVTM